MCRKVAVDEVQVDLHHLGLARVQASTEARVPRWWRNGPPGSKRMGERAVENGRQLVETARRLRPDVIIADITMPHLNGIDALVRLKRDNPEVRIVF
jgi:CheY-like chemotaxis protein